MDIPGSVLVFSAGLREPSPLHPQEVSAERADFS